MKDSIVQEYAPEYKEELISMILAIQQQEFSIPIRREDQPDLADIPQYYQQGNGNFWLALRVDEVAGTIGLIDIGNRQAALRKMFVKAAYRGKKIRNRPSAAHKDASLGGGTKRKNNLFRYDR